MKNWFKKLFTRKPKGLTQAQKQAFWTSVYKGESGDVALRRFEQASRDQT